MLGMGARKGRSFGCGECCEQAEFFGEQAMGDEIEEIGGAYELPLRLEREPGFRLFDRSLGLEQRTGARDMGAKPVAHPRERKRRRFAEKRAAVGEHKIEAADFERAAGKAAGGSEPVGGGKRLTPFEKGGEHAPTGEQA